MSIENTIQSAMTEAGLPDLCIAAFLSQTQRVADGETSFIAERDIEAVQQLPDAEMLEDFSEAGRKALAHTTMIKLNGGLGTSMGLKKAKTLLSAKEGLSFLEIILQQVQQLRISHKADLPLLFMNSFNTEEDTVEVLNRFPELEAGQGALPFTFVQNKVPKLLPDSLEPISWPKDPERTWCPPGHGDIYIALQTSGLLDQLLEQGIRYAFISNADNLGASLDLNILGYFAEQDASFMMEVADRTEADKKGGHIALQEGRLILRESAQTLEEDLSNFQDIKRHRYFNSNNLWVRLDRLKEALTRYNGILPLPLIQNRKTVDPRDANSPAVLQLETAMGAAIGVFEDACALRIPKDRFLPIKATSDLLGLWSNAYVLDESFRVLPNAKRTLGTPLIALDALYKNIDDFKARFPEGAPDLLDCHRLTIEGDLRFGKNIKCVGDVLLRNHNDQQIVIDDNIHINGVMDFE